MLPEGWKEINLTDLSTKISDGLHSTPAYVNQSDYFFINGNNLKDNKIVITENTKCVSEDEYLVHKKELGERTILMSINGTIGNIAYYSGEKVVLGKSAAYINLNHNVDKDYIFFYLASNKSQRYFESELTGTTIRNLSLKTIKATKIALPTLPEQQKIAKILSTWDKAIEKLEALIAAKQKRKKALMQQLLTGKKRFAGFEGEWKSNLLGEIAHITTGSSNRQDSHLTGPYTFFDRSEDIRTSDIYLFDGEAVIVAGEGQDFIPKYFVGKFDLHQRTYAIMDFKNCDGKFLYYKIAQNRNHFLSQAVGSTVKSLRLPMFKKMELLLPTLNEQQKIASVLSAADTEIQTHQKQLATLKQQKKGLMQQLLTGKKRVKVEAHV